MHRADDYGDAGGSTRTSVEGAWSFCDFGFGGSICLLFAMSHSICPRRLSCCCLLLNRSVRLRVLQVRLKISLISDSELRLFQDQQVLGVGTFRLLREVEAAGDDRLAIQDHDL